jgi:acetoin utilization protein AcuC
MAVMADRTTAVVWDQALLDYDMGDHPLNPVRVELTMALARELGVLDRPGVQMITPRPAGDDELTRIHRPTISTPSGLAPSDPFFRGWGLNTPDNPVFDGMHEASARICGATIAAADAVWTVRRRAPSTWPAGCTTRWPPGPPASASTTTPPSRSPGCSTAAPSGWRMWMSTSTTATACRPPSTTTRGCSRSACTSRRSALFPGTVFADEIAAGSRGHVGKRAPPARHVRCRLAARVPRCRAVGRAGRSPPEIIFSQCGADTHRLDPLADLRCRSTASARGLLWRCAAWPMNLCDGRWGGSPAAGGYALVEVVPRAWTHLLAVATGDPLDPATRTPAALASFAAERCPGREVPETMTDAADPPIERWEPGHHARRGRPGHPRHPDGRVPLHGLDPHDPRD